MKGNPKKRSLVFFKDGAGFLKDFGIFTMMKEEAKIFDTAKEIRDAQKALKALKVEGLSVVEFVNISNIKRAHKK